MTCVVGLEHGGRVYLGGDSFVSYGDVVATTRIRKVRRVRGMVVGASGSAAEMDVVTTWRSPRPPRKRRRRWLVEKFVPTLWAELDKRVKIRVDPWPSIDILVGIDDRLYSIDYRGGVASLAQGFEAIGGGGFAALGVFAATTGMKPRKRIMLAFEAAERITRSSRPPYTIVRTRRRER